MPHLYKNNGNIDYRRLTNEITPTTIWYNISRDDEPHATLYSFSTPVLLVSSTYMHYTTAADPCPNFTITLLAIICVSRLPLEASHSQNTLTIK